MVRIIGSMFMAILALSIVFVGEGLCEVTVASGFMVEASAKLHRPTCLAFAPAGSVFGADLFVGNSTTPKNNNDFIFQVSSDGQVCDFATLVAEADPVDLEFPPPGSPFGDFLYISANNRDGGRSGDHGGTILRVDLKGNVSDFTPVGVQAPGKPLGLGEPYGMGFGPGGLFGTDLFVANSQMPRRIF